jgi:hypothetical protein
MFVLDLQCDKCELIETFDGNGRGDTARRARDAGWIVSWQTRAARCPICSGSKQPVSEDKPAP